MLADLRLEAGFRRNWEQVRDFSPELYREYVEEEKWAIDSPTFKSYSDYQAYYCALVQSLVVTSKARIGRWQSNGKEAAGALETNKAAATPVFDFQGALAIEPLPLATSMVQEKVALLSANPPMPQVEGTQESQTQQVAGMNTMMGMVLSDVDYPSVCSDAVYDVQFWNAAALRWNVDPFTPGLFGDMGKIDLDKVDIDTLYWDPNCKKLHCKYMDYIVQKHQMEIGDIQQQYPLTAARVSPVADDLISDTSVNARNYEDYIQSPQPKLARDSASHRQKITVLECWIRDSRMKFEPLINDSTSDDYYKRFKIDEKGNIIGNWVKRYPNGRLIVVTSQVLLKDEPNPYPHGQFPYVFPLGMPASVPYAVGNALRIMIVTRKLNNIITEIHRYFQSEIPRPMHQDAGAILDPNLQQQVPNDPTFIVELAQGKRFERRQAVDIPQSVYSYIQLLQAILDMTSGSSGVMRGQLEEGDQLSAEAVGQLQQFASSRLALEARFFNTAIKQLGYQLMWLLRMIVKGNVDMTVTLPTGDVEKISWKSDRDVFERGDPTEIQMLRAKQDYLVNIKAGTGAPGAKQQQMAYFQSLFNDGAIDRQSFLDGIEYPSRQDVVGRMRQAELEDIQAAGLAKELGVQIKEFLKKQEGPGRREKVA